jgi:uncharacterized protein YutE (UPF0331/DUF86 family)
VPDMRRFSFWTFYSYVTEHEYPVDQTAMVLNLHISTEYWLDRMIQFRCSLKEEELEAFELTYAKKLRVLKKTNVLPEEIYKNLKLLNDLRNRFGHRLDYVLGMTDVDYAFRTADQNLERYTTQHTTRDGLDWQNMLADIGRTTLKPLEEYCTNVMGLGQTEDGQQ